MLFHYTFFDACYRNTLTIDSGKPTARAALADIRSYLAHINRRRGKSMPQIRLPNCTDNLRTWSEAEKRYVMPPTDGNPAPRPSARPPAHA